MEKLKVGSRIMNNSEVTKYFTIEHIILYRFNDLLEKV